MVEQNVLSRPKLKQKSLHLFLLENQKQATQISTNKMAAVSLSKRKPKPSKRAVEAQETTKLSSSLCNSFFSKCLYRIPVAFTFFLLLFLWSSTTTIISGNIVHVCVSSRKLNNLYCLSAGTQPSIGISLPVLNDTDISKIEISENQVKPNGRFNISESYEPLISRMRIKTTYVIENSNDDEDDKDGAVGHNSNEGNDEDAGGVKNNSNNDGRDNKEEDGGYIALKAAEEQIRLQRSWKSTGFLDTSTTCQGRGIFVYDLPAVFNKDLLGQCADMIPWMNICKYFENEGMGEPIPNTGKGSWYQTHQYSLEPIFHSRILKHPCRVYNENEAKLFYVPYYGGLDVLRWHFKNVSVDVKDALALDLMKWLDRQWPWRRHSGKDHVFVLGKITFDFRRKEDSSWGSRFLLLDKMQNPVKLLIERQPWDVNDIGIPHPTNFHPHSDEDIISWQEKIISSNRKHLISFAGAARPSAKENIRSILIQQCTSAEDGKCHFLDCNSGGCFQPESVTQLFAESEFCLQPPGDSPTRRSVFDSLVSGCIPVLFDPYTAYYQYPWHLPENRSKYSVFIDQEEVRKSQVNVVERLMKIPVKEREDMRRFIVYELMPGLVYGDSTSSFNNFQDSFLITMNSLLERINRLDISSEER